MPGPRSGGSEDQAADLAPDEMTGILTGGNSGPQRDTSVAATNEPKDDLEEEPEVDGLDHHIQRRSRRTPSQNLTLSQPQKDTRANIKIGSLNMNGRGANSLFNPKNKWLKINQLMREEKMSILAIQEAHTDIERANEINSLFKHLTVLASSDPQNVNSKGVAFVVNQRLAAIGKNMRITVVIPGRALLLETRWHNDQSLNILNIYAPNDALENKNFWKTLEDKWADTASTYPFPDLMLGDFNLTEENIDRSNGRADNQGAVRSLRSLCNFFELTDGWRHNNSRERDFTLRHTANGHQSRIDRIYVSDKTLSESQDWEIKTAPIPTDHRLISLRIAIPDTPFIGRGRWTIPNFVLGDRKFLQEIEKKGKALLNNLHADQDIQRESRHIQTKWKSFKDDIIHTAKQYAKKPLTWMERRLREIDARLKILNNDLIEDQNTKKEEIRCLHLEQSELITRDFNARRDVTAARNQLEGETICKYWTNLNRAQKSRDLIRKLRKHDHEDRQGEDRFTKRSDEMVEIARSYHDNLQSNDISNDNDDIASREMAIEKTLEYVTDKLDSDEKKILAKDINQLEVNMALASASNGKSPGLDGIPYELWKILHQRHNNLKKGGGEGFNVTEVLQRVFNNIENQGLSTETKFNEGWMCPIFKKNDNTEIANYRPITVLNTDYKLMTKAIQSKLALATPNIIHENQAGFMKRRSIIDHIQTINLMTAFAEISPENEGAIVALDRRKLTTKSLMTTSLRQ